MEPSWNSPHPPPSGAGLTFCIVGIILVGQAVVDGLAECRDQVVADVAAVAAFLGIFGGYEGKLQDVN